MTEARYEILRPHAAALIESMRDIGYSLESAMADIVDNAIAAEASVIDIRYGWAANGPWMAFVDNGRGMSEAELVEAMRPGTTGPLEPRKRSDLGRFGLGLKTASFSQARKLTVVSRTASGTAGRRWDLAVVSERDEWLLLTPAEEEMTTLPAFDELPQSGTIVVWQELDRLGSNTSNDEAQIRFNARMSVVRQHLALVFHRYLSGEIGTRKVEIRINRLAIEPFDPFNAHNPSTLLMPEEVVDLGGHRVSLQPYILPHHSKVAPAEYERQAGADGYLRGQGFYVYRNRRLIIHGTWFRLARQEELTKLARIRVDIPNALDHEWTIDVRKSRAEPPEVVRNRMRAIVERIRDGARRPYTYRGTVIERRSSEPVWHRREFNDWIEYAVNTGHPYLHEFRADMPEALRPRLDLLLKLISSTFPAPLFFSDMAGRPERTDGTAISRDILKGLADVMRAAMRELSLDEFHERLLRIEPFSSERQFVADYINALRPNGADS